MTVRIQEPLCTCSQMYVDRPHYVGLIKISDIVLPVVVVVVPAVVVVAIGNVVRIKRPKGSHRQAD